MAFSDVTFIKGQGGLGTPLPGEDFISAMPFYTANANLPSGFSTTNRIKSFGSIQDAEAAGIKLDYSDATAATGTVTIRGSDGALIKLRDNVPKEWRPFYNGWYRRNAPATSGVVIHHPYFDVKKIITYVSSLITDTYDERPRDEYGNIIGPGIYGATDAYWKVQYDGNSVTEGGSSGSPIFSQEGLIMGALTGGKTFCYNKFAYDFYGKFSYHWDYLEGENRQMKKYLDPINEGNKTLKGYDPNYPSGLEPEIVDNITKDIVIFPTMADNEINVNTSSIIRSIKIYDLAGRQIYTKSGYNASTATIPVDGWQKGVYSIVIQSDSGKLTEKFIKK